MKIFLKVYLILLYFQTFAIAACDVKAKFGDKKGKKEFIVTLSEYVGLDYPY